MTKLRLSVAMGDYDRTRALLDGRVQIDGVDPVYMTLNPEEMFFRAMRSQDFDISELSFSSYLVKHARGDCPYIAVPVFLSRRSATPPSTCARIVSGVPRTLRAAASAFRSTSSPRSCGRVRSCRTTLASTRPM